MNWDFRDWEWEHWLGASVVVIVVGLLVWWGIFLYTNGLCQKTEPPFVTDISYHGSWVEFQKIGDVQYPIVHPEQFYIHWHGTRSKTKKVCSCQESVPREVYLKYRETLQTNKW